MSQYNRLFLLVAVLISLLGASCTFEGTDLEARQCSRDGECQEDGFICVEGFCQTGVRVSVPDAEVTTPPPPTCVDIDGDGFYDPDFECDSEPDKLTDCNDDLASVNPDGIEICNGRDDDCDELVDTDDDSFQFEPCDAPRGEGGELTGACVGALKLCSGGITLPCTDQVFLDNNPLYLRVERACAIPEVDDDGQPTGFCQDGALDASVCDGIDNDCDGEVDENTDITCYTGNRTEVSRGPSSTCKVGTLTCTNGEYVNSDGVATEDCEQSDQILPTREDQEGLRCNGLDDDCDGFVDAEGEENQTCQCQNDRLCAIVPGNEEDSLRLENSCELLSVIDISNLTPEELSARRAEACTGACQAGIQRCVDGVFQECEGFIIPSDETCDPDNQGIDNNCNGTVDDIPIVFTTQPLDENGLPDGDPVINTERVVPGTECGQTVQDDLALTIEGICQEVSCPPNDPNCVEATSTYQCNDAGDIVCEPINEPQRETCDDILTDNNCDGDDTDLLFTRGDGTEVLRAFGDLQETNSCPVDENPGSQILFNPEAVPELTAENCCDTGLPGICRFGRWTCENPDDDGPPNIPALCVPIIDPTREPDNECDGYDQNCNSLIDEGNLRDDEANCGTCGNTCENSNTCCPDDSIPAPGDADDPRQFSCVDTTTDADNCGACGLECPDNAADCCDSGCVDTMSDDNNCGACGNVCGANEACCGGSCEATNVPNRCGTCDEDCTEGGNVPGAACCPNLVCAATIDACL